MTDPTLFDDPGIKARSTKLRKKARTAEKKAAKKASLNVGTWRYRIFMFVASAPEGITSKEIASGLANQQPCANCGCNHRPPIPVNQIASRLQELREWGYITHEMEGKEPRVRNGAEVHVVTLKGLMEL